MHGNSEDDVCQRIINAVPEPMQVVLGRRKVTVHDIMELEDDDEIAADVHNVGAYLILGMPENDTFEDGVLWALYFGIAGGLLWAIHIGIAWGSKGLIGRISQHLSKPYRNANSDKELYQALDDPACSRAPMQFKDC